MADEPLRLNEWMPVPGTQHSYKIDWPFEEQIDPEGSQVDVYLRDPSEQKFISTFTTLEVLLDEFRIEAEEGERASGAYVPLSRHLLLRKITHEDIEKSIRDMLRLPEFSQYFEKV